MPTPRHAKPSPKPGVAEGNQGQHRRRGGGYTRSGSEPSEEAWPELSLEERITAWSNLVKEWHTCARCELHQLRKQPVLLRGELTARVLFVGEAPGHAENVNGIPFVGPAGQLLDRLIKTAGIPNKECAFTNLLACIPLEAPGEKVQSPLAFPKGIEQCRLRLQQTARIVQPELVVWVGNDSYQEGPVALDNKVNPYSEIKMIHPAAILRMDAYQKPTAVQRQVIALRDAYLEL